MSRKLEKEMKNAAPWLKVIAEYLLKRDDIKENLEKENKSLSECGSFIMTEARRKGKSVCMTNEEVFGLAVHYYDEDDLKINKNISNQAKVEKSEDTEKEVSKPVHEEKPVEKVDIEEIVEKKVQERLQAIERKKKGKRTKKKAKKSNVEQVSLFDL